MESKKVLGKYFDGSPQRPFAINNSDVGVWSLDGLDDYEIYVKKGKEFSDNFWKIAKEKNIKIIFV